MPTLVAGMVVGFFIAKFRIVTIRCLTVIFELMQSAQKRWKIVNRSKRVSAVLKESPLANET